MPFSRTSSSANRSTTGPAPKGIGRPNAWDILLISDKNAYLAMTEANATEGYFDSPFVSKVMLVATSFSFERYR